MRVPLATSVLFATFCIPVVSHAESLVQRTTLVAAIGQVPESSFLFLLGSGLLAACFFGRSRFRTEAAVAPDQDPKG